jgi:hypothetical protein
MKKVHTTDLVPFLITRNKMYLCREINHGVKYTKAQEILLSQEIPHSTGIRVGDLLDQQVSTFSQDNSIKGYRQIVVENKNRYEQLILLGLASPPKRTKNIMRDFLPPIISSFARSLFRRL